MTSHGNRANNGKVRLATFLHLRFQFCWVPADVSRHFLLSAHFSCFRFALYSNWSFKFSHWSHTSGIMWLNTVLWLVHTPRCGATSCSMAKSQTLSLGAE